MTKCVNWLKVVEWGIVFKTREIRLDELSEREWVALLSYTVLTQFLRVCSVTCVIFMSSNFYSSPMSYVWILLYWNMRLDFLWCLFSLFVSFYMAGKRLFVRTFQMCTRYTFDMCPHHLYSGCCSAGNITLLQKANIVS